jgi:MFS family permease
MLLVGVTFGTVATPTYSLPPQLVPAARVGFAFGFITAFSNLGNLTGPAIAGALRDRVAEWSWVWFFLAAVAALGAGAALVLNFTKSRAAEPLE